MVCLRTMQKRKYSEPILVKNTEIRRFSPLFQVPQALFSSKAATQLHNKKQQKDDQGKNADH